MAVGGGGGDRGCGGGWWGQWSRQHCLNWRDRGSHYAGSAVCVRGSTSAEKRRWPLQLTRRSETDVKRTRVPQSHPLTQIRPGRAVLHTLE